MQYACAITTRFGCILAIQAQQIDDLTRGDHFHLTQSDQVLFLHERTSEGYKASDTNQLITNLKIEPKFQGGNRRYHKTRAIERCAREIVEALGAAPLRQVTLVPIPPSAARGTPEYDDRMLQVLTTANRFLPADGPALDIRELVFQRAAIRAAHANPGNRPTIAELVANYDIDERVAMPMPMVLVIVDDVLTAGNHFKAMQQKLLERFPQARTIGVFIARQKRDPAGDFEAL